MTTANPVSDPPKIGTPAEHAAVLARIDALMDAEPGSVEAIELQALATGCAEYERRTFPLADDGGSVADMLRQDDPEADFDFVPPRLGNELTDVVRIEMIVSGESDDV